MSCCGRLLLREGAGSGEMAESECAAADAESFQKGAPSVVA